MARSEVNITTPLVEGRRLDFDDDTLIAIAEVYYNEGHSELRRKEYTNAVYFYTEGIKVTCKDDDLNAKLYNNRATAHFYLGNYQESLNDAKAATELHPTYIEALEIGKQRLFPQISQRNTRKGSVTEGVDCHKVRVRPGEGRAFGILGNLYQNLGDVKKATNCYEQQLKIAKEVGDRAGEGTAYGNLGTAYSILSCFRRATECHELQVKIANEVGDRASEGCAYGNLGNDHYRLGDYKRSIHYHELCLKISKETRDRVNEGSTYGNLGNAYSSIGDLNKAKDYYVLRLQIANEVQDRAGIGRAYGNLGLIYRICGDVKKAIECHERHLQIAKDMRNKAEEGIACGNIGIAYRVLGDFQQAINYHELSLNIAKEVRDKAKEGSAYRDLGNDHYSIGDFKTAITYQELYLKVAKEEGNRAEEGSAYRYIGNAHLGLGDTKTAIHYHERQLKIAEELGQRNAEGNAYHNLGVDHGTLGDLKTAIVYHEDHLKIAKEMGDKLEKGIAYCHLGNIYQSLGNFKRATDYHELQLNIVKEEGNRAQEADAYCNLGNDHLSLGGFKKAVNYFELYQEIIKEVGNKTGEARGYSNLGNAYHCLGNFKNSMVYHKLSLKVAKEMGYRKGEGVAYGNIGNAYLNIGDIENAVQSYRLHAKIAKELEDRSGEGTAYGNLGFAYYILGDLEQAIEYHELHLKIAKEVGVRSGEGIAYGNLGAAYGRLGDFEKARDFNKRHLKIAKETGDKAGEAKAYYFLGCTSETVGSLHDAASYYQSSVKALNDVTYGTQFKDEWKIDLRHVYQNAYTALWRLFLKQHKVLHALLAAEQGRAQALTHLMELNYGFDAAFVGPHTLDENTHDIRTCASSNIVFTALGEQEIFFWVSQKGKDVELRRKEISDKRWRNDVANFVRSLIQNAFKEIGVRSGVKCEDRSLDDLRDETLANEEPVQQTVSPSLHLQPTSLRTLYDFVFGPVADLIHGNEIILVPEGPLCLLPFAAFMDSNAKYLSESFRIRVTPSLTSLKLISDCPADYHCKTGALLVGDPWVQEFTYRGRKLHQLPCAREEVEMIGRILNAAPLTETDATKDAVLQRLSSVALIHIAAHGRMETGEIALAPNPTRASQNPTEKDFMLTMADVLSVQVRARLVVLSCCHSGRGEIKAEGVVGIARAFMGAGARSVLVSLWAIDDAATLEFMKCFYQDLAKGRSASKALNRAMKSMRESEKFKKVKYWAPFVLIGDDVTLTFGATD
ncbi:hypothetical protein ACROYT_G034208 [Oculina patagonica]